MKKLFILTTLLCAFVMALHAQNVQYLPLYTEGAFSAKGVDIELPVGYTAGAINVSPTGGASYTIPITLPPGTKGVVPSVSVVYSSQGGNGMMGLGWNIAGLSAISRTGKNMHYDGEVSPVKLNIEDFFALDGNRLEADATSIYHTKMETFSKITPYGNSVGNPSWFKVEAKNGMVYEYGNTVDSKYQDEANTTTISWQLNKMSDQYGNYVQYVYEMNGRELRIKEINYTGSATFLPYNKIAFNYANRDDNSKYYIAGSIIEQKSLLTGIVVSTESNQIVKTYNFNYAKDYNYSYLIEIIEHGSEGTTLNSTIFKYGNETPLTTSLSEEEITTGASLEGPTDFFTGDINGDGYTDIVQAPYSLQDGIKMHSKFKVFLRNKVK